MVLRVQHSDDVIKLDKFFDGGEYGRDWVSRIVYFLIEHFFKLEEFVGHQLAVAILEVNQKVCHGLVDSIGCMVVYISEVHFLNHGQKCCTRD